MDTLCLLHNTSVSLCFLSYLITPIMYFIFWVKMNDNLLWSIQFSHNRPKTVTASVGKEKKKPWVEPWVKSKLLVAPIIGATVKQDCLKVPVYRKKSCLDEILFSKKTLTFCPSLFCLLNLAFKSIRYVIIKIFTLF